MKFNRKVAKVIVAALVSVLAALGYANSDKIAAVLNAGTEFLPEESAVSAPDAGVSSPVPAADAGL